MKRNGVVLAGLVMVLGLLTIIFAVLSTVLIAAHNSRRCEGLQRAARHAADSAAALVQRDPAAWEKQLNAGPVKVDIAALLPVRAEGSATLQLVAVDGRPNVSIQVRIESRRMNAAVTREVEL